MKTKIKAALLAVAAVGALATSAHADTDLIVGFTATSGNDVIYDLGSISSLHNGETWSLGSLLLSGTAGVGVGSTATAGSVANLNGVQWGVVADTSSPHAIYTSIDPGAGAPANVPGLSAWSSLDSNIRTILGVLGASPTMGSHGQVDSGSDTRSWNQQTVVGGGNDFLDNEGTPNVTGVTSDAFYQVPANNGDPVLLNGGDDFHLAADGTLTYGTAVAAPEPATYGVLAGLGLLVLSLRRQFVRAV